MRKILLCLVVSLWCLVFGSQSVKAQQVDTTMEAKVVWILEDKQIDVLGRQQPYQRLRFEILTGPQKGETVEYEHGLLPSTNLQTYNMGDHIILGKSAGEGVSIYYIVDIVRRPTLYWLLGLFVATTVLVAKRRALQSLLALVVSFLVIFQFVLPQILAGMNPVLVSMIAALLIIPVTFYLSHGINWKTHIAIFGTLAALLITAGLSAYFVSASALTGFSSEEATFLQSIKGDTFNIRGLILAGIIIGVLGILDDVTVSQSGLVKELIIANPKLTKRQLFTQAMNVGTDHIASMINTLVLVYAGAAMPLLLLFLDSPHPISEIINYEIVAEEIVRTLVGSIGLVLAVPLTTLLAVGKFRT